MSKSNDQIQYQEAEYRDLPWLVVFILHLIGIIVLGIMYGGKLLDESESSSSTTYGIEKDAFVYFIYAALCAMAVGGLWAYVWIMYMRTHASEAIYLSFGFCALVGVLMVIVGVVLSNVILIVVGVLVVLLIGLVLWCGRERIEFAAAVLECVGEALVQYSGPIYVAFLMLPVQILWIAFWSFSVSAFFLAQEPNNVLVFLALVSLYWTFEVTKNIVHCTTAGVVATWYLYKDAPSPTTSAFKRSVTTSLGSICLGSLIIAILEAIRYMVRAAARDSDNFIAYFVASCILGCIESLVRYFNLYAFTFVAIYGDDYITAAKKTWEMFLGAGFDAIINDDITGAVFFFGCVIGGLFGMGASLGLAYAAGFDDTLFWSLGVMGLLLGLGAASICLRVAASGVCTIFVCWCDNPAAFAQNHPEKFRKLSDIQARKYPEVQFRY